MPQLQPRQAPPPDYYADNVSYLLEQVARRNEDLLAPGERAFIAAWSAAGVAARRLFARLLTRKGPWFRAGRLSYPEVPDTAAAIAELQALGLVVINPEAPADALLDLFTRPELAGLFPRIQAATKPAWIAQCVGRYPDTALRARLAAIHPWLGLAGRDAHAVCLLLFYGSDRQDLADFVLQDLGLLRFEQYDVGPHTRPFAQRADLERYRECRRLAAWLLECDPDLESAAAVRRRLWSPTDSRPVARLRDRLLNRLGHLHERRGEFDEALESYGLSAMHPARERRARLLRRLGDATGFQALLAEAAAAPWSAEEEDFVVRSVDAASASGARPAVTERPLDPAELQECAGGSVERHAIRLLAREGACAWHLENHLPLGLAGLVFWAEVFAPVSGAFSHPFQQGPRDLFWPDFARVRAPAIAARVARLQDPAAFRAHLMAIHREKQGIANRLVHWGVWTTELTGALAGLADTGGLLALAQQAIADLERARSGFPDLTVVGNAGQLEFVEVKGPTDQLQPAQRTWLRRLALLGLPARVLKFRA